jgi:hypothetical protein
MSKKDNINKLNIELLNDFVYTVVFNASAEDKSRLYGKYLFVCENIKSAKRFIESSSREEKEHLLSLLGYQFFYVIAPYRPSNTKLKDFLSKESYKINDLHKEGYYIHSDKEVIHLSGLMVKYVHSGAYAFNTELLRQSYHVKKLSRKLPVTDESIEYNDADNILMRTLLSATITMNYQQGITGLSDISCQILLYLYLNRNECLFYEDIDSLFAGYKGKYKSSVFKSAINSLVLNNFIQRSAVDKSLTITSIGIKKCIEYRDAVLVNNNCF